MALEFPDVSNVVTSAPQPWDFLCCCKLRWLPTRPCGCALPVAAAGGAPVRHVDAAPLPALAALVAYHAFRRARPEFPCAVPAAFEDPVLLDAFWGACVPLLCEPAAAVAALLEVARGGAARGDALPAVCVCDALAAGLDAPFLGYMRADAQLALLAECRAAAGELRGLLTSAPAWRCAADTLDTSTAAAAAFLDAAHALGGVALAGTTPLLRAAAAVVAGRAPPALPLAEPDAACDAGWLAPLAPARPPPPAGSVWSAFSAAELACAWAALDWDAFRCVPLHELYADASAAAIEDCYHHGADMFLRFTRQRANAVSLWVYAEVAGCRGDVRAAAALLECVLAVAGALRALRDFTGAFALGAGLDVMMPEKLGAAWALMGEGAQAERAALVALVNSRNQHEAYLTTFKRRPRGAPCVPYLGAHNKQALGLREEIMNTRKENVKGARALRAYWGQLLELQERGYEESGDVPAGAAVGAAAAALRAASRPFDIESEAERKTVELQLDAMAAPLKAVR